MYLPPVNPESASWSWNQSQRTWSSKCSKTARSWGDSDSQSHAWATSAVVWALYASRSTRPLYEELHKKCHWTHHSARTPMLSLQCPRSNVSRPQIGLQKWAYSGMVSLMRWVSTAPDAAERMVFDSRLVRGPSMFISFHKMRRLSLTINWEKWVRAPHFIVIVIS